MFLNIFYERKPLRYFSESETDKTQAFFVDLREKI